MLCRKSTWISDALELLCGDIPGMNSAKVFHPKSRLPLPGGYDLATDRAFDKMMSPKWFQIHTEMADTELLNCDEHLLKNM